ncbi:NUDIX domain-containing protein [Candidatus Parcubacteria bacterium]|nr:NUDIX domain-containing protein [Candidatus Parcubacteria bacterium]
MVKQDKKIICHDLNNNKFEVKASKVIFRPSVYGILIENNKVLLSKQWDGYDMPGGGVDINETLEEALKREFFEETGIKVEVLNPVHSETSFFNPSHSIKHKNEYWNCPLIYYLVKKVGGKISKDNLDEEERGYADLPEWIDLDKIDELKFFNSVDSIRVIKKAAVAYFL